MSFVATVKMMSWNVNGRVRQAQGRQLAAILDREPDLVALQEVTPGSYDAWVTGLVGADFNVLSSMDLVLLPYPPPDDASGRYPSPPFPRNRGQQIQRKNFNLLASKHPIDARPGLSFKEPDEAKFSYPEKYLAASVALGGKKIEIHNAHLPPGASRGLIKVHAFEAIRRRIDEATGNARILCGDFNAPWSENDSGPVIERGGNWSEADQDRWVEAEKRLLTNPEMRDVYRDVHPDGADFPASHHTGSNRTPHRYDYILASKELQTQSCCYFPDWTEATPERKRLSDHAPVEAVLTLKTKT